MARVTTNSQLKSNKHKNIWVSVDIQFFKVTMINDYKGLLKYYVTLLVVLVSSWGKTAISNESISKTVILRARHFKKLNVIYIFLPHDF